MRPPAHLLDVQTLNGATLHTVTYDCLDYYCDRSHLVGVFATEADAESAIETYKAGQPGFPYRSTYVYAVAPIIVGKVYDE